MEYTTRRNANWQIDVIPAATAHLPHVRVSWYPGWGLWTSGVCAVLPGETAEQAADRAYPESAHAAKTDSQFRCINDPRWVDALEVTP